MPDAGKDAEEKWSEWKPVIKELLGTVEVWWERTRGKEYQSITFGEITRELNALQQQLADVRQERDRFQLECQRFAIQALQDLDRIKAAEQERDDLWQIYNAAWHLVDNTEEDHPDGPSSLMEDFVELDARMRAFEAAHPELEHGYDSQFPTALTPGAKGETDGK